MDLDGITELKKHRPPDSRMDVPMLDDQPVNNKFYCKLQRNCEETDQRFAMAPELHNGDRILVSMLGNTDCSS